MAGGTKGRWVRGSDGKAAWQAPDGRLYRKDSSGRTIAVSGVKAVALLATGPAAGSSPTRASRVAPPAKPPEVTEPSGKMVRASDGKPAFQTPDGRLLRKDRDGRVVAIRGLTAEVPWPPRPSTSAAPSRRTGNSSSKRHTRGVVLVAAGLMILALAGATFGYLAGFTNLLGPRPSREAARAVLAAYQKTSTAASAQFTLDLTGDVTDSNRRIHIAMAANGQWDITNRALAGSVKMTVSAGGGANAGSASSSGSSLSFSATVQFVEAGSTEYMQSDLLTGSATTPWVSEPMSAADNAALGNSGPCGALNSPTNGAQAANPTDFLSLLQAVSTSATDDGSDVVDSTPAEHYSAEIAVAKLTSQQAALGCEITGSSALADLGGNEIPVEIWIDASGRVIQEKVDVTIPPSAQSSQGGASQPTAVSVTIGFSHYGDPVTVTVPPPAEVTPLADISTQGA